MCQEVKSLGLQSVRRLAGRMLSVHLVCSKLDSLLFGFLHLHGQRLRETMNAHVIMHNMIIESEREHPVYDPEPYHRQGSLVNVDHQVPAAYAAFLGMRQKIRDANTHSQLQDNLV
jgi:hypothetical protein